MTPPLNRYTFRLDVIPEVSVSDMERRIQSALDTYPKYCISFEISDKKKKEHYQGIVFGLTPYNTYKKYMENLFPEWKGTRGCKGAGKRSFAEVKKDEYEIYVVKDQNIKFKKGYTDEELTTLMQKSYPKSEAKKKLATSEPFWMKLYEDCKAAGCTASTDGWALMEEIIESYQQRTKAQPSQHQLRCYAETIQRHMVAQYAKENNRPEIWAQYKRKFANVVIGSQWVHVTL